MKVVLFALFIALLLVGCEQEGQSVGSDGEVEDKPFLPSLPSLSLNESKFERTKRLAESGNIKAQHNLGFMYENGKGVPEDDKEAVKWYARAAEQGLAKAQSNLGNRYYNGEGVPQDYKEAVKWYTKAAEQGLAGTQFNLGMMYHFGKGVPQDNKHAVKWYTKSAEQGYADAQLNLGIMYLKGDEVIQDYVTAYAWLKANGSANGAKGMDLAKKLMTKEQIAEAQKLAREIFKRTEANRKD